MAEGKSITSTFAAHARQVTSGWWGGIGCRVSFVMTMALVLVAALAGAFFFWEGEKNLDIEIRGRAMYVARELAALTADDIITGNRFELYKKLTPPFSANEEILSRGAFFYLMIYNHNCDLLIGSTATDVFIKSDSYYYTLPSGKSTIRDDVVLRDRSWPFDQLSDHSSTSAGFLSLFYRPKTTVTRGYPSSGIRKLSNYRAPAIRTLLPQYQQMSAMSETEHKS